MNYAIKLSKNHNYEEFYNEDGERFLDDVVNLKQDDFLRKVQEKRKEEEEKVVESKEE